MYNETQLSIDSQVENHWCIIHLCIYNRGSQREVSRAAQYINKYGRAGMEKKSYNYIIIIIYKYKK